MSNRAIRVEDQSKCYRLGQREPCKALRDVIVSATSAPYRLAWRGSGTSSADSRYIWALKDVSLEGHQGEIVGMIGRNGAGKTTLLKVLSHVTEPT